MRIPERELTVRFGVSRTPVREALKVLAAEGFVRLLPNRGAMVRGRPRRELAEIFDHRGARRGGRAACRRGQH